MRRAAVKARRNAYLRRLQGALARMEAALRELGAREMHRFGSAARGDVRRGSDPDQPVVLETPFLERLVFPPRTLLPHLEADTWPALQGNSPHCGEPTRWCGLRAGKGSPAMGKGVRSRRPVQACTERRHRLPREATASHVLSPRRRSKPTRMGRARRSSWILLGRAGRRTRPGVRRVEASRCFAGRLIPARCPNGRPESIPARGCGARNAGEALRMAREALGSVATRIGGPGENPRAV